MVLVIKLIVSVILLLVQPRKTIQAGKSIKINEKMIYDCVDFYKQPSLSHPLLQNHKIQMEPSFAISKQKNQVKRKDENIIECPNGTVPILRNTKEFVTNARHFMEKHFNPFTVENQGTHIAGIRLQDRVPFRGIAAFISVHDLNISKDQASFGRIYVGSEVNNKVNSIQTGWMVNPSLFGDSRSWGYGFMKGADVECYFCLGFVQVSKTDPLYGPLPQALEGKRNIGATIQQDPNTGNWWRTDIKYNKPDIAIGYWPKELFDLLDNGVNTIGVGGAVQASPSGISPPMGNGHLPTKNDMESARVADILIKDSSFIFRRLFKHKLEYLLDSKKCYGLKKGENNLFTFGGPGGNFCGK